MTPAQRSPRTRSPLAPHRDLRTAPELQLGFRPVCALVRGIGITDLEGPAAAPVRLDGRYRHELVPVDDPDGMPVDRHRNVDTRDEVVGATGSPNAPLDVASTTTATTAKPGVIGDVSRVVTSTAEQAIPPALDAGIDAARAGKAHTFAAVEAIQADAAAELAGTGAGPTAQAADEPARTAAGLRELVSRSGH